MTVKAVMPATEAGVLWYLAKLHCVLLGGEQLFERNKTHFSDGPTGAGKGVNEQAVAEKA